MSCELVLRWISDVYEYEERKTIGRFRIYAIEEFNKVFENMLGGGV